MEAAHLLGGSGVLIFGLYFQRAPGGRFNLHLVQVIYFNRWLLLTISNNRYWIYINPNSADSHNPARNRILTCSCVPRPLAFLCSGVIRLFWRIRKPPKEEWGLLCSGIKHMSRLVGVGHLGCPPFPFPWLVFTVCAVGGANNRDYSCRLQMSWLTLSEVGRLRMRKYKILRVLLGLIRKPTLSAPQYKRSMPGKRWRVVMNHILCTPSFCHSFHIGPLLWFLPIQSYFLLVLVLG